MTDHVDPILVELQRLDAPDLDPREALAGIEALADRVSLIAERFVTVRARAIRRARLVDITWREIGEVFGVTAQRAEAMSRQGNHHQETHR